MVSDIVNLCDVRGNECDQMNNWPSSHTWLSLNILILFDFQRYMCDLEGWINWNILREVVVNCFEGPVQCSWCLPKCIATDFLVVMTVEFSDLRWALSLLYNMVLVPVKSMNVTSMLIAGGRFGDYSRGWSVICWSAPTSCPPGDYCTLKILLICKKVRIVLLVLKNHLF